MAQWRRRYGRCPRREGKADNILVVGEERLGTPDESIKEQLNKITDLQRLTRMIRREVKAGNRQEIVDTL
jgi:hypothetical protein